MRFRPYPIAVIFIIITKMTNAVSVRLQGLLEFAEKRSWRVETLVISVPAGRQRPLLFVEKLVGNHAHDKPTGPHDPVPIAYRRSVVGSVLEHVTGVDSI